MPLFRPLVGRYFITLLRSNTFDPPYPTKEGIIMRKIFLIAVSLLFTNILFAQKIAGVVKDQQGKGLDKTTVSLLNAKDSSVVKLAVTDEAGKFSVETTGGSFLLSLSHVGFIPQLTKVVEVQGADVNIGELIMEKLESALAGVTVTSQKPMIEVRADKTILNVEGTINAQGQDAFELLRKSPGVIIDKDDNLSLAGKNGVQVYIDGKPSPLSGADLANYLKSMQSSQIEAVELITNPSAKYEAAGNAGIINIKLKKNKSFGTNGSVNAGYSIGTFPKYNGGLSLNHRNKKVNLFGNYNINNGENVSRMVSTSTRFDTLFAQQNRVVFQNNSHGFKAGMDYFAGAKTIVGVTVNGNLASNDIHTAGPMVFTHVPTNTIDRTLVANNRNDIKRDNINANLNYRYAVTGGTELNIDADYGFFNIRGDQFQPNYYLDYPSRDTIHKAIYNMIAPTDIDLYSIKADYEQNYRGGRLGIGGKIGFVNTDNDFQRYNVFPSGKVLDTLKSNKFAYKENINAVYVNYNKGFKGFMMQVGLRVENTHAKGTSEGYKQLQNGYYEEYDSSFNRNYTDFFPSAALTLNKNPMNQWSFSYSRRIDRPAYQDLNPFEFKLNEYTYMKGNTQLQPQYTNSFGITNIYKFRLTTALNYSHVKDIFAQIPDTVEKTKGFLYKQNLATQDIVSLNVSYPFQYKWYSFFATANAFYSYYKANLGGGDRNIEQGVFSFTYFMQNSFKLGKGWTGEISGYYSAPTLWQGVFKSKALGFVDVGLQKQLFENKATLRVGVSDIFRTLKWQGTSNFTGANMMARGNWESRLLKVNFSYRFGNSQVKAARQRKSAIEEENKRANQSGGQIGGPAQ